MPGMFQAYNSRWRLGLLFLAAAGFVALGLWLIGAFSLAHPQGLKPWAIGWLSIVFFGFCGVLTLRRMGDRRPVVQIDERGVFWRQWSPDHAIPWTAIDRIGLVNIRRQKMLGVGISEHETEHASAWRSRLARANQAMVGFPVCLTVTGTDRSFGELVEAMECHAPAHLTEAFRLQSNR
jgi:hypothetical protein